MTTAELYEQFIKPLSPPDRLRLASMILNGLTGESQVDTNDAWNDEDLRDFTTASACNRLDP